MRRPALLLATCFATLFPLSCVIAQDQHQNWPRFRGPLGNGVALDDERLPTTWSKTDHVKWVVDVPGWGWSCPIVWDNRVFVTTVTSDEEQRAPKKGLYLGQGVRTPSKGIHHWLVYCFDLNTGDLLWKREAHRGQPAVPRHPKSTYAAETPVTDGHHVYVLFGDLGLWCYDMVGNERWVHRIEPRKTMFDYGAAASPVVHDGQVIYVYDNQEQSYIASIHSWSGREQWRTLRDEPSTWATPFVWQHDGDVEIVVNGKKRNRAYDLNGKEVWWFDGRMSNLVIPSPFAANGLLYITSGYVGDFHRPVYAVRPGARGEITLKQDQKSNDFISWYLPQAGPYNPSPILYGKYYYTLLDRGFVTCHDAATGKEIYGKQRFAPGATFTASPWAYNGKLFFLSEDGDTYVVAAGSEFKLVGKNSLDELTLATPAISQGKLIIRTASKLYCISND